MTGPTYTFIELYSKGLNDPAIAKELGVTKAAVWKQRTKLGLRHNSSKVYRRDSQ